MEPREEKMIEAIRLANEARRMMMQAVVLFTDAGEVSKALTAAACALEISTLKVLK